MYEPNDKVIKDLILKGVRSLNDAHHESMDKHQTALDICKEIQRLLPMIEATPKYL